MIRIALLSTIVFALSVYAWRDWFRALCGLIVMMAVLEHPDMPKQLLGIPGMNLWNVLFLNVVLAWGLARSRERLKWDAPRSITVLLLLYLAFVVISTVRLIADDSGVADFAFLTGADHYSSAQYLFEYVVNSVKFVVPGLLVFDGARSRERLFSAASSVILLYFILGILTIKAVGLSGLVSGDDLQRRALKVLSDNVGYHRVNLAMMMSGAFWATYAYREHFGSWLARNGLLGACLLISLAMALTGGRTGYATWGALAIILATLRWRRLLIFAPVMAIAVILLVPAVSERVMFGISDDGAEVSALDEQFTNESGVNTFAITSGRVIVWPLVIEKIGDAPIFGHGREAMQNTGISSEMADRYGLDEAFPHPHNAYLQFALDNGMIGLFVVVWFFYKMIRYSITIFRSEHDTLHTAIGGIAVSLIGAFLIASLGSQTFYPREGSVGMWVAIGLVLRLSVDALRSDNAMLKKTAIAKNHISQHGVHNYDVDG